MGQTVRFKVVVKDGIEIVEEIHKVVIHRFRLSDVDDPDLYAAEPLYNWEKSEQGQFVMEHAKDKPEWHRQNDYASYGYQYIIIAELEKKKLSEFYMRWGKP
jgi:hypothetical protein